MNKAIKRVLQTHWMGQNIYYYKETDSTNIQAKSCENAGHGALFVADKQTAGRGRLGRSWESPAADNIYMTLRLEPEMEPDRAPMLTLVMALSVAEALNHVTGLEVNIKWPNDIVVNKKKICGILTEMSVNMTGIAYVVIGVGVNVNTKDFPEEIRGTAASLYTESGRCFERSEVIAEILKQFEVNYETFMKKTSLADLMSSYNTLLINRNKEVRVLEPGNEYNGYALGINEAGELLVKKEDGSVVQVFAGEVSVRGLLGYV